jgi:hypothetical protein
MNAEQEARQHAIERMCHLQALVAEQVHHWQHAADCFCGSLSDEWHERNYRNDEEAIAFIEDAVVAAVSVAAGRSEDTIRSVLGRLETEPSS